MARPMIQTQHLILTPFGSDDPFASPTTTNLPSRPEPVALPSSQHSTSDPRLSWTVRDASPGTTLSEKRDSAHTLDEQQWQKQSRHKRQYSSVDRKHRSYDNEKASFASPQSSQSLSHRSVLSLTPSARSGDDVRAVQQQHALKILLYLSGPSIALSFVNLLWAVMAMLVAVLFAPLRLCTSRLPLGQQICHFLAPTLSLQLRCIYSPPLARPTNDDDTYSAAGLGFVHLLAPILALGVAMAAWVIGLYWALARVVGDPSGTDKRDDGVEAVLGLRRWWEQFLLKGVRH